MRRIRVAVLAAAVLCVGCSAGRTEGPIVAVGLSTTTTGALRVDEATPSTRPPVSPTEIASRLDAAVAGRSFCAFYEVIESSVPKMDDHAAVISAYAALAKATPVATAFVPAELAGEWKVVAAAIVDGSRAVKDANGDVGDPSVRMVFEADETVDAERVIERWVGEHCGAGAAT